jgi:hypothetical protein
MLRLAAFAAIAMLIGYGLHAFAQGRLDVPPPPTAIGTSSSNGISFAWFYQASERTVYVCRLGQGAADALDCKAKATLPQ